MAHNQKTGLKLLIAAFVFGATMGYIGALWQICAAKSLREAQALKIESSRFNERR